jgi:hypothetical protein
MAKIIGQDVDVAITKESPRGVAASAVSGDWVQRGTLEIKPVKDLQEVMVNEGRITTTRQLIPVHFEAEITITMPLERKHVGKALMGFYGSLSTGANTPESGTHTHTYTILDSGIVPTYTISVIQGAKQFVYALGFITNLKIDVKEGALPEMSVTFLAKKEAETSALTASYPADSWFSPVHANVYAPLLYANVATAYALDIAECSIEFTRDALKMKYLGADTHEDVMAGDFVVKAHVVSHWEEKSWASGDSEYAQDDYRTNTTRAFRLKLVDTNTTLGSSTNPAITIDIPSGKLAEYTPSTALKELVGEEWDVMAFDDGTNEMSQAVLVNDVSAY